MKGVSAEEEAIREILVVTADGKWHRSGEFVTALKNRLNKVTTYKYMKIVVKRGLLEIGTTESEYSFKIGYRITPQGRELLSKELAKKVSDDWINKRSESELKNWVRNLAHHIKEERERSIILHKKLTDAEKHHEDLVDKLDEIYNPERHREDELRRIALEEYYREHPLGPEDLLEDGRVKASSLDRQQKAFDEWYELKKKAETSR